MSELYIDDWTASSGAGGTNTRIGLFLVRGSGSSSHQAIVLIP